MQFSLRSIAVKLRLKRSEKTKRLTVGTFSSYSYLDQTKRRNGKKKTFKMCNSIRRNIEIMKLTLSY